MSFGKRALAAVADQGFISINTLLVVLIAARELPTAAVGRLALWQVVVALLLLLVRPAVGDTWLLHQEGPKRESLGVACWAAMRLGLAGSVAAAAVGATTGAEPILAISWIVAMPFVAIHDLLRVACAHWRRAWVSGSASVTILVITCVLIVGGISPIAAWPISTSLGVLLLLCILRVRPIRGPWFAAMANQARPLVTEMAIGAGLNQILLAIIAYSVGIAGAGAIRVAQSVLGILSLPIIGLSPLLLSFLQEVPRDVAKVRRRAFRLAVTLMTVELFALTTLLGSLQWSLDRKSLGARLLGESSWVAASDLMLPLGLTMVAGSVMMVIGAGVRVLGLTGRVNVLRLRILALQVACFGALSVAFGVAGAAWGFLFISVSSLGVYVWCWSGAKRVVG